MSGRSSRRHAAKACGARLPAAAAQDLYDQDLFRPFGLTFHQADYWQQLLDNRLDGIYIPPISWWTAFSPRT